MRFVIDIQESGLAKVVEQHGAKNNLSELVRSVIAEGVSAYAIAMRLALKEFMGNDPFTRLVEITMSEGAINMRFEAPKQ